jgi:hypothetical protein
MALRLRALTLRRSNNATDDGQDRDATNDKRLCRRPGSFFLAREMTLMRASTKPNPLNRPGLR